MRLIFIFLSVTFLAKAQFTYMLDQSIPVLNDTDTISNPWAGGLNAAQINSIDLNNDGLIDLAVFDRMADRILTFMNVENKYQYAPEYESLFPIATKGFMLLRDFNCDGRPDLFTKDLQGIKVFKNTTSPGSPLSWKLVSFYTGFPGSKSDVLLTKGFSGKINLQLQSDDLPALMDADGDGDLDIFNVKFVGTSTIEFHKNFGMERYGTCDSLDFERITQRFGDVEECDCGDFAFGEPCTSGGRTKHVSGKALTALDLNNDTQLDILYSEGECSEIFQLINKGDLDNPTFTEAIGFPENSPLFILPFPAAYFEDIDFDGVRDLIASPNIYIREFLESDLKESVYSYKNVGSNNAPEFFFQKSNFLQEGMIDVGDNAVPAFFDADADGDLDMFIGYNVLNLAGSIYYFQNVGTRYEPSYKLITDDFGNFSFFRFTNIKPQFVDMNGDTKTDLVFTASNSQGLSTQLYFIANNSNAGLNFSGQSPQPLNFSIFSTENIHVTYVNNDLLPDLLVGKQNGSLQYWENSGTPTTPNFILANAAYLGLGSSVLRQSISASSGDLDIDGKTDLVIGDQSGNITIISDFKNVPDASNGITEVIYNPILQNYGIHNLGGRIWPVIANMYNTTKPAIAVGNIQGGVHVLKNDESTPLPVEPQIQIFPNPASKNTSLNITVDRPGFFQVFTVTGQEVGVPFLFQGQQLYPFETGELKSGIYIIRFYINGKFISKRIVIL